VKFETAWGDLNFDLPITLDDQPSNSGLVH